MNYVLLIVWTETLGEKVCLRLVAWAAEPAQG